MKTRLLVGRGVPKSARGLAQSKTLRDFRAGWTVRQLLDCGSPLPLSLCGHHWAHCIAALDSI